ncbi:hypothetical protein BC936DRAFT_148009 [Jimgerdemannia flammicorona]|uniref:Six-hairpin glycosidase-like protein n=1 Tax=Jimgerdemannia flammicorona TaxID=994334 RepID=A0A433D407_9FUNG|nr:hypothetical protein BC936DRAFT_148009 [Jimgerdemannia flammicorona]
MAKHSSSSEDTPIDASGTMEKLYDHYTGIFDQENGGLGGAPKFPTPPTLYFLSRFYADNHNLAPPPILDFSPEANAEEQHRDRRRDKAERSADMVCHTLRNVALGGIHDHLGGGFHRYSVDAAWHVPHFEKMIYDQAQLLNCYLEAYSITGDEHMANAAKDIVSYLERDMTHPKGGFYSAQDADSLPSPTSLHKVEGAYYVWTKKEIEDVLRSARDVDIFCHHFGVREEGNVDKIYDPHGELEGKNILTLRHTLNAPTTDRFNISTHKVETFLAEYKRILLSHRQRTRPAPHRDDKIITGWNGLAISALSRAGLHLLSSTCLDMATRAAEFAYGQLWDKRRKRLRRCYYDEDGGGIDGFADDYANMIRACLDLYEVGWDERWVEWAAEMQQVMVDVFEDQESGGFFGEAEDVGTKADGVGSIARLKDGES